MLTKIKRALKEYKRIIRISKKPNRHEFSMILKICGLGVGLIGLVGFIMQLIYQTIIG